MEEKLTWRDGYKAVYSFLDGFWRELSQEDQETLEELERFLSGMLLVEEEGVDAVADETLMELWHQAVDQVAGDPRGDLSSREAYQAMVRFLSLWSEPNSDGTLLGLCQELARSGPEREDWDQVVALVRQGEFDPYFGVGGEEPEEFPLDI